MTEQQDKISFLLDEFSGDAKSKAVLDEVEDDVNLQYNMRRYQMIGQAMRHELPGQINTDFSASVMAEIDQIENVAKTAVNRKPGLNSRSPLWTWPMIKPFAGMAIAASVAIVSISLWQTSNVGVGSATGSEQIVSVEQQKIERLASQSLQTNAVTVSTSLDNGMRWKITNNAPALQQKLNAYLVNHTEYSNSIQGLIPQARVAGFDAQK
jgi:negative regulator of sigma E activity